MCAIFKFQTGEVLPEVRLHYHHRRYATAGRRRPRDERGADAPRYYRRGEELPQRDLGGELFRRGELLDAAKYCADLDVGRAMARHDGRPAADRQPARADLGRKLVSRYDLMEKAVAKIPRGRSVLVTESEKTIGHQTLTLAAVWKPYLEELLRAPGATSARGALSPRSSAARLQSITIPSGVPCLAK